jgi:hypothetical protein
VVNGDRTATALTVTVNFPPAENAP